MPPFLAVPTQMDGDSKEGKLLNIMVSMKNGEPYRVIMEFERAIHIISSSGTFREAKSKEQVE